jgi:hypothetical protein
MNTRVRVIDKTNKKRITLSAVKIAVVLSRSIVTIEQYKRVSYRIWKRYFTTMNRTRVARVETNKIRIDSK